MLDVRNLTYEVIENGEKITIVKDINFTVEDGEMLVITGPNGGGKSTVAKLLMGVLATSNGEILLDGKDITGMYAAAFSAAWACARESIWTGK